MRIIGGRARGRRLKAPKGLAVRPTSGRVKEALFNILPRNLGGLNVLDLFAGSGNLTIEALSRGAARATLVDSSSESAKVMRENLAALSLSDRARILTLPVSRALRRLARQGERFDVIFLDPPYERGLAAPVLHALGDGALLRPSGVVIAEHSVREHLDEVYGTLALDDRRRYGATVLSFYRIRDRRASNP